MSSVPLRIRQTDRGERSFTTIGGLMTTHLYAEIEPGVDFWLSVWGKIMETANVQTAEILKIQLRNAVHFGILFRTKAYCAFRKGE
jgi:hypothetical protein